MRSVQKTRVKKFRLSFSTGSASRNSQSKKVEAPKPFFDCIRKLDLGVSRKRPFSTDKSDCISNGLMSLEPTVLRRDLYAHRQKSDGHIDLEGDGPCILGRNRNGYSTVPAGDTEQQRCSGIVVRFD